MTKQFEEFDITGYDVFARALASSGNGEVLLLCNNSSHFLVAVTEEVGETVATLVDSFTYDGTEDDTDEAYHNALLSMAQVAWAR